MIQFDELDNYKYDEIVAYANEECLRHVDSLKKKYLKIT